jgi:hypothetical protein
MLRQAGGVLGRLAALLPEAQAAGGVQRLGEAMARDVTSLSAARCVWVKERNACFCTRGVLPAWL